jgi:hypothetical protein
VAGWLSGATALAFAPPQLAQIMRAAVPATAGTEAAARGGSASPRASKAVDILGEEWRGVTRLAAQPQAARSCGADG